MFNARNFEKCTIKIYPKIKLTVTVYEKAKKNSKKQQQQLHIFMSKYIHIYKYIHVYKWIAR